MANTVVYEEDWAVKLQDRLDYPTTWKDVCRVEYTNSRVFHNPYMSTTPSVQSHTRGTAYTHQTFGLTDESVTIDTSKILPMYIDRADLAQSTYANQMETADLQGQLLNEHLESAVLADHANWTNFDGASIGGSAGNITVSASNIDDIIRGIKREIGEANGQQLMDKHGAFIVWRYQDMEYLEQFAQANGFMLADRALKDGVKNGYYFMNMFHYVSNSHTSGHLFGGVRNLYHLGILKATYGQVVIDNEPATSGGALSAIGIVSRVDYKGKVWNNISGLLYDITVN
jgi:hypothetical protein